MADCRPGDQPRYRVGRHCPWNIYRIHPDSEDRDRDYRFAVAIGPNSPADGPLIVQALNGWQSTDSDLRSSLAEARSALEEARAEIERLSAGPTRLCDDCSTNYRAWAGRPAAQEAAASIAGNLTGDDRVSLGAVLHSLDLLDDEDLSGMTFKAVEWFEQWLARRSAGLPEAAQEAGEPSCACPRVQIHAHACEGREAQTDALVEAMDDHQSECGGDTSWAGLADVSLDSLAEVLPGVPSGGENQ